MNQDVSYRDDVEMEPLTRNFEEPDSPLPSPTGTRRPTQKPRWLTGSSPRWRSVVQKTAVVIRPCLTWKYIFLFLFVLYFLYCLARGSPLFASRLPAYTGQHDVGTIDLEIPLEKPRNISDSVFIDTGKPAFELETVLFSLYYPSKKGAMSNKPKHPWIPRPVSVTGEGYARVAHINNFLTRPLFTFGLWALGGSIEIPANVDVPMLEPKDDKALHEFPVIVFSHGTASSRTDYTQYCGELASRGVIVAAIEHRDGSGPGTIINTEHGERTLFSFGEDDVLSDPPMNNTQIKKEQLDFRQAEIEETLVVLRAIHRRNGPTIFKANKRKEGQYLKTLEGRFKLDEVVIAGHSYGATGAMQAIKGAPSKDQRAIGGIMFDPGKGSGPLNSKIDIPILVVHSNSWSKKHSIFYGRPHFDTVKDIVQGVLDHTKASWFVTMLGTSHPSITDAPIIEPLLLRWTTGATISVIDGLREYVKITMEFLEFLQTGNKTGILAEKVTHPQYDQDERSEERMESMPKDVEKFWQIHVAPDK